MHATLIAIDTSKSLFTLHGVDDTGRAVLRRDLKRRQVETFFKALPPTDIVLEACGGSHHWGRVLGKLGHHVRLIPPQHVKPFVKRGKNDRIDALAISEAARRPEISFVPVRSAEAQAEAMILSARDLLIKQRTQLANAIRGHAAEFGLVAAKGIANTTKLVQQIEADPAVPEVARPVFAMLAEQLAVVDDQLAALDRKLDALHKANAMSQLLADIPGVGPITALSFALKVEPAQFRSGRHLAAWLGLTPKEHSTAGRQRLGSISRAGNERLRQLLVVGAMAVIKVARPGRKGASAWLLNLLGQKPRKLVAVALANKMARIIWAMMTRGEAYRLDKAAV
jgi:transposase